MRRAAASAALLALLAGCGTAATPRTSGKTPPSSRPRTFTIVKTSRPPRPKGRYLVAYVEHPTPLRARPGGRVVTRLRPKTEFGSQTVLSVLRRSGRWLQVAAAQLPNGRRAWVPAARVVLGGTDYAIVVDRSRHRARLRHGRDVIVRFPVAVGRPGNETPLGRFAVTDKLRTTDSTSPYGCCAIALTGHQTKLEPGWPGGDRLAIHGTPATWSIGQAVSLGCMRTTARALHVLMRRVPLGAPVFIRA